MGFYVLTKLRAAVILASSSSFQSSLAKAFFLSAIMSFRKRSVVVAQPGRSSSQNKEERASLPGVRPSPLDGRPTTSTGTRSLDSLLAGHAGLTLGTSLLIEESGTTDFGGALLRYFAAEGVVQGHQVHLLGVNEFWGRELPGLSTKGEGSTKSEEKKFAEDKMKIAWRYERLGEFGAGSRGGCFVFRYQIFLTNSAFL